MTAWPDLEDDLRRVLEHPGFVELSNWPELDLSWKLGLRLGAESESPAIAWGRITWFCATSLPAVLTQAVCGLELLGAPVQLAKEG
jgi:hypothetical protein